MIPHDKLVRDRIPEILAGANVAHEVRVLDDAEYARKLDEKLGEELAEYQESGDVAELIDLVEVARAVAERRGMSWDEFCARMEAKRAERGGFQERLLLEAADE